MRLTKTELEKIVHNVLFCDFDREGRLHFRRFSDSQRSVYAGESESYGMKANASASVTFELITDSEYLAVKFELYPGSSRACAGFDLYVDGIFWDSRYFDDLKGSEVRFELPWGEHRVTLYFPWSAETVVREVRLTDGASLEAVTKRARMMTLGDSITQGYVAKLPSLTYVNQLSQNLDLETVNQGIGGFYFQKKVIDDTLVSYGPDLITIAYGTNDYTRYDRAEEFHARAAEYMERLVGLFPDTKMLAILPVYRNDLKCREKEKNSEYTMDDAREILSSVYKVYENVRVVEETGIPRIPEAYVSDYVHPCELGFTFMAKTLEQRIRELLCL